MINAVLLFFTPYNIDQFILSHMIHVICRSRVFVVQQPCTCSADGREPQQTQYAV